MYRPSAASRTARNFMNIMRNAGTNAVAFAAGSLRVENGLCGGTGL